MVRIWKKNRIGTVGHTGRGCRAMWASLTLVSLGVLVAAGASGHVIKPHFDLVWERIRYHDTFHDGHGHDGYGHGFHMESSGHIHDDNGMAVRPPWPPPVIRYQPGQADNPPSPARPYGGGALRSEAPPGPPTGLGSMDLAEIADLENDLSVDTNIGDLAAMPAQDVAMDVLGNAPYP